MASPSPAVANGPALVLRAKGLGHAARARLFAAWTFADYGWVNHPRVPPLVWPSLKKIGGVHAIERRTAAAGLEAARKAGFIIPLANVTPWSRESMQVLVNHGLTTGPKCQCFAPAIERCSCRLLVPLVPDPNDGRFGVPLDLKIKLFPDGQRSVSW